MPCLPVANARPGSLCAGTVFQIVGALCRPGKLWQAAVHVVLIRADPETGLVTAPTLGGKGKWVQFIFSLSSPNMAPPTPLNRQQLSTNVAELVVTLNAIEDPEVARALLVGGIIANLVGHLHEEQWRGMRITAAQPCGTPGCQCELVTAPLMDALDATRDDRQDILLATTA